MKPIALSDGIFWIGVNDTSTRLFEGLWTIEKEGISYNSYLIKDEKSTLIDLCKDSTGALLMENIKACIDPRQLTYLVVNHMEPDHSGAIRELLQIARKSPFWAAKKRAICWHPSSGSTNTFKPSQIMKPSAWAAIPCASFPPPWCTGRRPS